MNDGLLSKLTNKVSKFFKCLLVSQNVNEINEDEDLNMSAASDIVNAVKTYIETPDTRYAIMIDGDWGCGKTYLWKNTLLPIIGESEALYISLYGLQDINDIENEIFKSLSIVGSDEDGILKGIINSNLI